MTAPHQVGAQPGGQLLHDWDVPHRRCRPCGPPRAMPWVASRPTARALLAVDADQRLLGRQPQLEAGEAEHQLEVRRGRRARVEVRAQRDGHTALDERPRRGVVAAHEVERGGGSSVATTGPPESAAAPSASMPSGEMAARWSAEAAPTSAASAAPPESWISSAWSRASQADAAPGKQHSARVGRRRTRPARRRRRRSGRCPARRRAAAAAPDDVGDMGRRRRAGLATPGARHGRPGRWARSRRGPLGPSRPASSRQRARSRGPGRSPSSTSAVVTPCAASRPASGARGRAAARRLASRVRVDRGQDAAARGQDLQVRRTRCRSTSSRSRVPANSRCVWGRPGPGSAARLARQGPAGRPGRRRGRPAPVHILVGADGHDRPFVHDASASPPSSCSRTAASACAEPRRVPPATVAIARAPRMTKRPPSAACARQAQLERHQGWKSRMRTALRRLSRSRHEGQCGSTPT